MPSLKRREFIAALGSVAATGIEVGRGQNVVWRIGVLETTDAEVNLANLDAFREGLRARGYIEGRNLRIEYRSANGQASLFPQLASDLVRDRVDVILTRGTPAVIAAKNATTTIPIVMAASGEPAGTGVVAGLSHPGGNITGLTSANTIVETKRFEILRELLPRVKRVAALYNMSNPISPARWKRDEEIAQSHGIEVQLLDVRSSEQIEPLLNLAMRQNADAIVVGIDALLQARRSDIAAIAVKLKLPTIFSAREFVEAGGLSAYAVSYPDLYRRAAFLWTKF